MSNIYAIHNDHQVVNVIVADSAEIAEAVTGLNAIPTAGEPWIGWVKVDDEWVMPEAYVGPGIAEGEASDPAL